MGLSHKSALIGFCCFYLAIAAQASNAESISPVEQPDNSTSEDQDKHQVSDEVRERELSAEEDPLVQHQHNLIETLEEIVA